MYSYIYTYYKMNSVHHLTPLKVEHKGNTETDALGCIEKTQRKIYSDIKTQNPISATVLSIQSTTISN